MGIALDPMAGDNEPGHVYWNVSKPDMSQTEFKNLSGIFKRACERALGKDFSLTFGEDKNKYWWNVTKPNVSTTAEFKKLDKAFREACELAFGRSLNVSTIYSKAKGGFRP